MPYKIIFSILLILNCCYCSANPDINPAVSPTPPIPASKLTSYPIIVSDLQASDLFDAYFPVFLTIDQIKVEFSRAEWTKSIIFDKLAAALHKKIVEKFCVNFVDEATIEFTKDERSVSVLLLRAIKEDNHLIAYQC
uniref:Uncharacterized protein n=1 Tax=Panagrolaimus superbus TaxID=310955 RepID=A0A914XU53_9BILA